MDPLYTISRGYWEDIGAVRDQWISAYKQIAKKHVQLQFQANKMIERIKLACSLLVTQATFYDIGNKDECFYAEAVERENKFLERTEKDRKSLDGNYPCGNEKDMMFARRIFSIREMAYLQMGLAEELNPDDVSAAPPSNKIFAYEAYPNIITAADQPKARKGFVNECLGRYAEAIECYEAMEEGGRPTDRIKALRKKLEAQA